ncbi:MAG TPA: hypothetical protein VJ767_07140 [Nitrososphaeraceae archaeon]|nr:hypothetical protein [Nitrososphaeraceae archaeon]
MTFSSVSKSWSSIDLKFMLSSTSNFTLEIPSNLDGSDVGMPPMATILSELESACAEIEFEYYSNARCICFQSVPSTNQRCLLFEKNQIKSCKISIQLFYYLFCLRMR